MTIDQDPRRRLEGAGVITRELPPEYEDVINNLSAAEVDVILSMKSRLDEAGRLSGLQPGESGLVF
jgi:hypothetical protein